MRQNLFQRLNEIQGNILNLYSDAVRSCNPCPVVNMAQFNEKWMSKFYVPAFETRVNGCVWADESYVVDYN